MSWLQQLLLLKCTLYAGIFPGDTASATNRESEFRGIRKEKERTVYTVYTAMQWLGVMECWFSNGLAVVGGSGSGRICSGWSHGEGGRGTVHVCSSSSSGPDWPEPATWEKSHELGSPAIFPALRLDLTSSLVPQKSFTDPCLDFLLSLSISLSQDT